MNVAEYGGSLQRIGLQNLMELARVEQARREFDNALADQDSEAKATATGELVGTVVGAGKGYLSKRKDKHDAKQAADMDTWRGKVQEKQFANHNAGLDWNYELPARPVQHDYSAWDDLLNGFKDSDLGD